MKIVGINVIYVAIHQDMRECEPKATLCLPEEIDKYSVSARRSELCRIAGNNDGNDEEGSPPPFLQNYPP